MKAAFKDMVSFPRTVLIDLDFFYSFQRRARFFSQSSISDGQNLPQIKNGKHFIIFDIHSPGRARALQPASRSIGWGKRFST